MSPPAFSIPPEFANQLDTIEGTDPRSNEKILESLSRPGPITSEKNIWCFWDKGCKRMPQWCQQNVCDWVRICSRGAKPWTVRLLDAVPDSPNYALNFVPKTMLPRSFAEGDMEGPYVGPHSADFLRGAVLYLYGGLYIDVGCILFRNPDRFGWDQLEDPASPYQISVPLMYGTTIANHVVMSRKGDPYIKRWHDLFVHLWQGRKSHVGICDDPLLAFSVNFDFEEVRASKLNWNFKVEPRTAFEYIAQVLAWSRLTMLEEAGDGFSCTEYWQKHVLVFDALLEDWGAEATVGFDGQTTFDALATPLDANPESQEYKTAHELVWRLLTQSTMQKVVHGKNLTSDLTLGTLWEMPENLQKHNQPGTFGELLRYGSVHFQQTRKEIEWRPAKAPKTTMKKGVFEP